MKTGTYTIRDVFKSYPGTTEPVSVLKGVSLDLRAGDSVALMGDSGCGKSTLLHVLTGLDKADKGQLILDDVAIENADEAQWSELRRYKIGLIFQHFNLIPSMSVGDNIRFHASLADRFDKSFAKEIASHLGIAGLLDRRPEELSGGQQQRVAIARTLVLKPDFIFADEPTGNLDEKSSGVVLDLALDIVKSTDAAFFMVTHSRDLAQRLKTHLVLRNGQCTPLDMVPTGELPADE